MWDLDTIVKMNGEKEEDVLREREESALSSYPFAGPLQELIKGVLDESESLSLDSPKDRAVLLRRLLEVLQCCK